MRDVGTEITPAVIVVEFGHLLDDLRAQREHHANPRVRANAEAFGRMTLQETEDPKQFIGYSPDGEVSLISFAFDQLAQRYEVEPQYQQIDTYRLLITYH